MNLSDALAKAADLATTVAPVAPAPFDTVAKIAAAALKAGTAFAAQGKDPVAEVTRMLTADPEVKRVHDDWDAQIAAKFGSNR